MAPRNIKELLSQLRERPGLYISLPSIHGLRAFLNGCFWATELHNIDDNLFDESMSFHDWVAMHEGYSSSVPGWANMINDRSENDTAAIDTFFDYYDRYNNRKADIIKKITLPENKLNQPWRSVATFSTEGTLIEERTMLPPRTIEIVSYYDGPAVFVRYLNGKNELIEEEEYYTTYERAAEVIHNNLDITI